MLRRRWMMAALAVLSVLVPAGTARAHRLDAQAFVLKDRKVQVEAWFPSGVPARGARVQVLRAGGELLTQGKTNEEGIFRFTFDEPEPLRIVISDGAGHRKELSLSSQDLARPISPKAPGGTAGSTQEEDAGKPVILANRNSGVPVKDVIVGVGFLLAVAAFFLSLRNARRLREITKRK
jgi:hypothetical protein